MPPYIGGIKIALTISPTSQWWAKHYSVQFKIQRRLISEILDKLGTPYHIEAQFYPLHPDIHWHGLIEMPKAKTRYYTAISALRKACGHVLAKVAFDASGWMAYSTRDREQMRESLNWRHDPYITEEHQPFIKPEIKPIKHECSRVKPGICCMPDNIGALGSLISSPEGTGGGK